MRYVWWMAMGGERRLRPAKTYECKFRSYDTLVEERLRVEQRLRDLTLWLVRRNLMRGWFVR